MTMEAKITLVVVGYNRADALRRVLRSLEKADYIYSDVRLVISLDYSGKEDVIQTAEGFVWKYGEKIVLRHPKRLGLRRHIISCGDLTEKYGAVMILEDDLYVSPDFYNYSMKALEKYGDHPKIAGIALNTKRELLESAYPFFPLQRGDDIFFQQFATSWGQVWNEKMWKGFRAWYDTHQQLPRHREVPEVVLNYPDTSWAKFYQTYIVDTGKYFVYSYHSLTTNFGDAGQHFGTASSSSQSVLFYGRQDYRMPEFEEGVKYDIYGEPAGLGRHLGVPEEEFTCDMWGRKRQEAYRRYVLSSRRLPYQVMKSFGLRMKPMELNIMEQIEGDGLFLYDTGTALAVKEETQKQNGLRLLEYSYGILNGRDLLDWALERMRQKIRRKHK